MSEFGMKIKDFLSTSAKFVGKTANTAAKATKYKVDELSTLSKRRDMINDLGTRAYELSINGVELPDVLTSLANQIKALDGELDAMRAEHAAEKAARAAEKAAAKAAGVADASCCPQTNAEAKEVPSLNVEADEAAVSETEENDVPTLNV